MDKSGQHVFHLPVMILMLMLSSCAGHYPERPNIVLFIADDLSWWDLVYGTHTTRGIISGKAYPIRSVRDREFKYIMNLASDSIFQNVNTHGWTWSNG